MPVVRLSYPKGALTQDRKARLAADLTEIVLDAEVDAVTDGGRMSRRHEIAAAIGR